jgi:ribonucleoside-triphosphate reductase (formate)
MENNIKLTKIKKRNGSISAFVPEKIKQAILKAFNSTKEGTDKDVERVFDKVLFLLNKRFVKDDIPTVEQTQDIVEESLILKDFPKTAKAYILYRESRRKIRDTQLSINDISELINSYVGVDSWEVNENSNTSYSLQGLNVFLSQKLSKTYWLNEIYTPEIRDTLLNNWIHIHDLGVLSAYCCGWDLYDLLKFGFTGVYGKVESSPPKHFRSALGQAVNFLYTLSGEAAGAQAFSSFDTLLAPFIRYDNLTKKEVKQALQEFIFNCNIPTRVGFQCPFTNITLDLQPSASYKNMPVIIGGKEQKETYGDFQEEMNLINSTLCEVFLEGDAKGRIFTFPIPTYNITKDFDWDNKNLEALWQMTAKYGIPYFSNFVNSDLSPDDARSMCCRLRLDNRELIKRGGGLFGSNPKTGSIGVVTINLPKVAYTAKTRKEFFEKLKNLMVIAKDSLEIKRKAVEDFTNRDLYPYSKFYLKQVKQMRGTYWANHFSTIGIIGANEAALNFLGENIGSKEGKNFTEDILNFMRDVLIEFQEETGCLYNLEATPAEGTSYRLAKIDKKQYPEIITQGTNEPYYTNSVQLPVNYTDDLFEYLDNQDSLQTKFTGGTVVHGFLGEEIKNIEVVKNLIKTIFTKYKLPYFSVTPTFSVCPVHGYISGEHHKCPKCLVDQECEIYSRVVGYIRPVKHWNEGKKEEFTKRKTFNLNRSNISKIQNKNQQCLTQVANKKETE